MTNACNELIRKIDEIAFATKILNQFVFRGSVFPNKPFEILGARMPEFIDTLVIIPDCNNPHIVVMLYKSLNQRELVFIHVLRFVDDQYIFCNATQFHIPFFDAFDGAFQNIVNSFQTADLPQQIEAIGMEGLYLDEIGGVADQFEQPFLKFGGRCP